MDTSMNSAVSQQDILSAIRAQIHDASPDRRILYLQNNWIYGNNDKLVNLPVHPSIHHTLIMHSTDFEEQTIINGPGTQRRSSTGSLLGATLDTPDSRDITSNWRRVPGEPIVFEQENRIYGDNHRLVSHVSAPRSIHILTG